MLLKTRGKCQFSSGISTFNLLSTWHKSTWSLIKTLHLFYFSRAERLSKSSHEKANGSSVSACYGSNVVYKSSRNLWLICAYVMRITNCRKYGERVILSLNSLQSFSFIFFYAAEMLRDIDQKPIKKDMKRLKESSLLLAVSTGRFVCRVNETWLAFVSLSFTASPQYPY